MSQRNHALFIRGLVVSPHSKQRATRYGSRENSTFSSFWLSVRIVSERACGVDTVQASHCSTFSFALCDCLCHNVPSSLVSSRWTVIHMILDHLYQWLDLVEVWSFPHLMCLLVPFD
ncbi:hypothetical protein SAMN05421858_3249 [Haladaptatus litoreus]|uniref:Uncharacterized protein n=1 Tax=Haladaptatus litoreus TaxID=553468 RepID=A0A1N7CU44_9EURY|nr:hypothetical protein SAMN05421858_3249 [Haladaptatus litoreus]